MSEKIKNTPSRGPLALVSVFCLSLCACESIVDEREQYSLSEETTHSYLDSRLDFLKHVIRERDIDEAKKFFDSLRKNTQ